MTCQEHRCEDHAVRTGVRCWDCLAWVTYCAACQADLTEHHRDCGSLRTWCQLCRDETTQHTDCPYA